MFFCLLNPIPLVLQMCQSAKCYSAFPPLNMRSTKKTFCECCIKKAEVNITVLKQIEKIPYRPYTSRRRKSLVDEHVQVQHKVLVDRQVQVQHRLLRPGSA
jgi:hypothetical protein